MKAKKIKFNQEGGPVTIEITVGYVTLGTYILYTNKNGEYNFQPFGDGKLHDQILDQHPIPIDLSLLHNYTIVATGKYAPAPGHNQIKVSYLFVQDANLLHEEKIEEVIKDPYKRFRHYFQFQSK